jgi:MFS family permease
VVLRLVHGLTGGGESGGAAVLAIEHAPPEKRARYGVFTALGAPAGTILANVAFALVLLAPPDSVRDWAWRVPFLFGGVVLLLGLWMRKGVAESPVFQEMMREEKSALQRQVPVVQVFRDHWRRLLLAAGLSIGINAIAFTLSIYMLSYATAPAPDGLALPRQPIIIGSIAGLLLHGLANVLSAHLSDRVGRRPVMIVGTIVSIAAALVIFPLAEHGTVASMDAAIILGFFATGLLFGPMYTYLTELFPREQRQTGMGIAFQTGAVLGGGTAPVIANRIVAGTGNASNVGYYLAAVLVVSLVCLIMLPETAPARIRAKVQLSGGLP